MFDVRCFLSRLAVSRRTTLLAVVFAVVVSSRADAEPLDRQLLLHAPEVLKYCRDKGYNNVGVLKFRVKKGQAAVTDNVGTLNLDVANRLELALVLANRVQEPLGIVHDASAVATAISGANHTVAEGRPPFFTRPYPLAWGSEQVTPDAFLTGVIRVRDDLKQLAVGIVAFDRQHPLEKLEKVVEFDADVDPFDLIGSGESFLRGALDNDEQQLAQVVKVASQVVESASLVRTRVKPHPLTDPDAPVALEILYGNTLVPIEFRSGEAFVREPDEGQRVSFVFKRKPSDATRYALVLKVNGLNTLYKQRLPALECNKWVLEPDLKRITVVGFQKTNKEVEAFKVLSRAASKQREMDYGADVGTISLVVFGEGKVPQPALDKLPDDLADDLAVLSREPFPSKPVLNLSALQFQLRDGATRGMIAEGEVLVGVTRKVEFIPYPVPLMSVTITYYAKK